MERQTTLNEKQVEKLINLENEILKFIQVFYLPLATGLAALYFTSEPLEFKIVVYLTGGIALGFLYLMRRSNLKRIAELIDELQN